MIEEWIMDMAILCLAIMGMAAWGLSVIFKIGDAYINNINNEENGEED